MIDMVNLLLILAVEDSLSTGICYETFYKKKFLTESVVKKFNEKKL